MNLHIIAMDYQTYMFNGISYHIFSNSIPTDQDAIDLTATRDSWWHNESCLTGLPNTVCQNPQEFVRCRILEFHRLGAESEWIYISRTPVVVKSVVFNGQTYNVRNLGQKYVMFEMRRYGLHFLPNCLEYDFLHDI